MEARQGQVEGAEKTFVEYGVDKGAYDFVHGELFTVLQEQEDFDVDVVLCLGFMDHTLRYPEILHAITNTTPTHCVIDTKIIQTEPTVLLGTNDARAQSAAAKDNTSRGSTVIAGWPSLPAVHMLVHTYGMDLEDQFDWPGPLAGNQDLLASVRDYHTERRVTLRYRRRGDAGA